jgi:hypothetical protein
LAVLGSHVIDVEGKSVEYLRMDVDFMFVRAVRVNDQLMDVHQAVSDSTIK